MHVSAIFKSMLIRTHLELSVASMGRAEEGQVRYDSSTQLEAPRALPFRVDLWRAEQQKSRTVLRPVLAHIEE